MTPHEYIQQILHRVEKGEQTDEDIKVLRQLLLAGDRQVVQQLGKYNVNIGEGKEIHIGDRTYYGTDAEAIKEALRLVLQEKRKAQHFALRVILYCNGYIPRNYARFLDYCTDRLFLQRVGGRYRFIHRLLQEHFATMPLEK